MRHTDRIYELFSDAIQRAVKEHGCKQAPDEAGPPVSSVVMSIWRAAEDHGAYAVVDRMLFRFGRYRLSDCAPQELDHILAAVNDSLVLTAKRMPYFALAPTYVPSHAQQSSAGDAGHSIEPS